MNASDEDLEPNTWYRLMEQEATTQALTVQPGWEESILIFQSSQNTTEVSTFVLDAISIEVCTTAAAAQRPARSAESIDVELRTLDGRPVTGDASITPVRDRPWPKHLAPRGPIVEPAD
jgi:hypothetical protein